MKKRIAIKIFRKMRSDIFAPLPNYNINQLKCATRCLFGGKGIFESSQDAETFYSTFADALINYDCQLPSEAFPSIDIFISKLKRLNK